MSNQVIPTLEACVETFADAVAAQENGASRIELCDRLDLGGTTPSVDLTARLLDALKIPIMVMVRPRGGNFVFSESEFFQMKEEIEVFKKLGCMGVVIGLLTPEKKVDVARTRELVELARPMQVTFHKAFDECPDLFEALDHLKITGVDRLLTSGGQKTAAEAVEILNQLIEKAGEQPRFIVAGRVTHENICNLRQQIPFAQEFHGRKIVPGI